MDNIDRRKHYRHEVDLSAMVNTWSDPHSVTIRDASECGMSLLSYDDYKSLSVGETVEVELTIFNYLRGTHLMGNPTLITLTAPYPETMFLVGRIRHLDKSPGEGLLIIGLELDEDRNSPESIDALIRYLTSGPI